MKFNFFSILLITFHICYSLNVINDKQCNTHELNTPFEYENENINENTTYLKEGRNILDLEKGTNYVLNFSNLTEKVGNQNLSLLFYNNLSNAIIDDINISQFDIFNKSMMKESITFQSNETKSFFLDIKIVNASEYILNKNINISLIREKLYDMTIDMLQGKKEFKIYINLIPNDNNSDLYFLTTNKSSVRDENKDKFKLYYYNDFGSKTLDEIIGNATENPMKRERYINGKAEIFGYSYDGLNKDIGIEIKYKRIKGDGITGPIVSLSVLFVALVIVLAIFIKNTYFDSGNKRRSVNE